MSKFKGKYRIDSLRKPYWNYATEGTYHLVLVTQGRKRILSFIKRVKEEDTGGFKANVVLSDFGEIVKKELLKSFEIRSELHLTEYVIMPDHVHMLVSLKPETEQPKYLRVKEFKRLGRSISSFMAGFKSAVNTAVDNYIDEYGLEIDKFNRNNHFFLLDYYDGIIEDENRLKNTEKYIQRNPEKWKYI